MTGEHSSVIYGVNYPNRLFVGCLPTDARPEDLGDFFAQFGNVLEAKIVLDGEGCSKRFGFVTFSNSNVVSRLIRIGGLYFKGKIINVGPAVKKNLENEIAQGNLQHATWVNMQHVASANTPYSATVEIDQSTLSKIVCKATAKMSRGATCNGSDGSTAADESDGSTAADESDGTSAADVSDRVTTADINYGATAEINRRVIAEMNRRATAEMNRRATAEMNRRASAEMNRRASADMNRRTTMEMSRRATTEMSRRAPTRRNCQASARPSCSNRPQHLPATVVRRSLSSLNSGTMRQSVERDFMSAFGISSPQYSVWDSVQSQPIDPFHFPPPDFNRQVQSLTLIE